jgi:hypothetical protein
MRSFTVSPATAIHTLQPVYIRFVNHSWKRPVSWSLSYRDTVFRLGKQALRPKASYPATRVGSLLPIAPVAFFFERRLFSSTRTRLTTFPKHGDTLMKRPLRHHTFRSFSRHIYWLNALLRTSLATFRSCCQHAFLNCCCRVALRPRGCCTKRSSASYGARD